MVRVEEIDDDLRETLLEMIFFMMLIAWMILMIYTSSIVALVVKVKKDLLLTFAACISVYFILFLLRAIFDTILYQTQT